MILTEDGVDKMLNVILAGFLFCVILGLCFLFLCFGFYIGTRIKKTVTAEPLSDEEQKQIKKLKKEMENFWTYDGNSQS